MTSPRTILGRAAILLGLVVALASLTGAAPAQQHVGACEPDGTSVENVPGYNRLEYALDQYARHRGYTIQLEQTGPARAIAGYVDALPSPMGTPFDRHACFYVPATLPPLEVVPTIWRRTIDTMRQLDHVALWANE